MSTLKLKEIPLGSIDAKNEVLNNTPEEIQRFINAFVCPPALSIEKFLKKQKYYIVGLKGTGKTALLRYISLKLEEEEYATSSFVLFKADVDEDLKKDFSKAARVQIATENAEDFDGDDFEAVWRWFIYRKIAAAINDGSIKPFQRNSQLTSFLELVTSEALAKTETGLMRLVPRIRKGNIEISNSPKLGLELDWDDTGKAKVNFNNLVRQADQAFAVLEPGVERLNIFFDELELSMGSVKQYQRDSKLIRDVIISVEKINAVAKRRALPICLYAAIRSEVLVSVEALGKEINKPITDFGSLIAWNRPGLDAAQQPILSIIEQRINIVRQEHGLSKMSSVELWKKYFPREIDGRKPQIYILHNSWYRPRDVMRLLISIQEQYPEESSFILQGIEAVRKSYSTASWVELTEELKAKYKGAEIDGIKYIFYGHKQIMSLTELSERANIAAVDHKETKQLLERFELRDIAKDLFRVGVIGNIDRRNDHMRFSFRGDDEILFEQEFFVHNALRAHLSI